MAPAPKMISRRYVMLLTVLGVFMGAFLVASKRLGDLCPDGSYCGDLTGLRHKAPTTTVSHDQPSETAVVQHEGAPVNNEQGGAGEDETVAGEGDQPDETKDAAAQDPSDQIAPVLHDATHNSTIHNSTAQVAKNPDCENFPDTSNILLVMKTGATEAYNKIPVQVMTNLKCLPEYFIFSDMEQRIAGHQIYDSLDTVLSDVKTDNNDFELYFRQQTCAVDQELCNKGTDSGQQAWSLDKYKNIHIAEKTYRMRPDYDWYVFVDADTYVVWPTMVEWLSKLDASDKHYLGSVAMLDDFPFAHGGSGYITSRATMSELLEGKSGVANGWDHRAKNECCGDYLFAKALQDNAGIEVESAWPTINGEKPHTMPYHDEEWCQPIATMHHMSAEEVSDMDAFERARNFSGPMRIKDLYYRFFEQQLEPDRSDWDNLSDDVLYLNASAAEYEDWEKDRAKTDGLTELEEKAHLTVEDCREACLSVDDCAQYRFSNGICGTTHKFKHGAPKRSEDDKYRWTSGWDVDQIKAWVSKRGSCGAAVWPVVRSPKPRPQGNNAGQIDSELNYSGQNNSDQSDGDQNEPETDGPKGQDAEENPENPENPENAENAPDAPDGAEENHGDAADKYDAAAMSEERRWRRRRWAR